VFQIIKRNQKLKDQAGIQKDQTSIPGRRKEEDNKVKYILIGVFLLFIYACENTRQSIGVTTNPLSSKMEDKTKVQWKITFGKIRPKEDTDED